MTELVTLNWVSFLMHIFGFTLLFIAFVMPYWFAHEDGANEFQNGGLWRRCRVGGGCVPLKDASEDLAIHMTPTQVLVTLAFVCAVVSTVFYALWLWKGEMCDTPWKKRCNWCAETYIRSRKPKTPETNKYRQIKWAAFGFSLLAGAFCLVGTIVFMVNTLLNNETDTDQVSWCAWIALASGTLLVVTNVVIGLCTYLLKIPAGYDEDEEVVEAKLGEYDLQDEKEMQRVKDWVIGQKEGYDNPSISRDWNNSIYRNSSIYSTWSHRSNHNRNSGIFYIGQNDPPRTASLNRSVYSREGFEERFGPPKPKVYLAAGATGPMYTSIFRGKIPMIPKQPMTPEAHMIYNTIYGYKEGNTVPPVLSELLEKRERTRRPASSLGITQQYDDINEYREGIYDRRGRPLSDSNLMVHRRPNRRFGNHGPGSWAGDEHENTYQSFGSGPIAGPFEPGEIPEARRRRKHPNRRSTSSLATTSTGNLSHDPDATLSRIRSKFPDESDSSLEISLSHVLSHGMKSPVPVKENNFEVDNIWVVPNKDEIPEVLGKNRVHFKLEKSIQELDEFDLALEEEEYA